VTAVRSGPGVVGAGPADLEVLSDLIAAAFHDLAPSRWLIADPAARRRILPGYFGLCVAHALGAGLVHTTPGRDGVALWLPAGPGVLGPPLGQGQQLAVVGSLTSRFRQFDQALEEHHPVGVHHQYLAILAVRPGCQGRGIGTALLNARHDEFDRDGVPAYLEASSPRTRGLYQRHGYTLRPGAPFHLPDDGPPMWPMWRQPRTRGR